MGGVVAVGEAAAGATAAWLGRATRTRGQSRGIIIDEEEVADARFPGARHQTSRDFMDVRFPWAISSRESHRRCGRGERRMRRRGRGIAGGGERGMRERELGLRAGARGVLHQKKGGRLLYHHIE